MRTWNTWIREPSKMVKMCCSQPNFSCIKWIHRAAWLFQTIYKQILNLEQKHDKIDSKPFTIWNTRVTYTNKNKILPKFTLREKKRYKSSFNCTIDSEKVSISLLSFNLIVSFHSNAFEPISFHWPYSQKLCSLLVTLIEQCFKSVMLLDMHGRQWQRAKTFQYVEIGRTNFHYSSVFTKLGTTFVSARPNTIK